MIAGADYDLRNNPIDFVEDDEAIDEDYYEGDDEEVISDDELEDEEIDEEEIQDLINDGELDPHIPDNYPSSDTHNLNHHQVADVMEDDEDIEPEPELRRGTRVRRPPENFIPGASHAQFKNTIEYDDDMCHVFSLFIGKVLWAHSFAEEHSFVETYSIAKGIKKFGDRAVDSLKDEVKQIHERRSFRPIHFHELTREQKEKVIDSMIFWLRNVMDV